MKSWRMRALAIMAGLAVTATGCSGGSVRQSTAARPFVYSYNLNVVTDWDPATSYSNEMIAMQNVYESLTRYDSTTKSVKPLLATKWSSGDDGKKWTFTLRDNVKFHTGTALTSSVAKAAIERTKKMKGGAAYIWDAVDEIETPGPTTLVFNLKYAAPMDLISSSGYAAFIYDTTTPGGGDLKDYLSKGKDTGSGPYTVGAWDKGKETELRLNRFEGYWGGWQGAHYDDIEFRVTPQLTTAWQQLQTGDVTFVSRLNPQLFDQAKGIKSLKTSATPSFQNLIAFFNTEAGPLQDARLRKAVQAAVDYNGLVSALKGSVTPASGVVPAGLTGSVSDLTMRQNAAEAARLLNEAGYGPGKKSLELELTFAQGDADQQTFVTLLSSALQKLNVKLQAKPMQWDAQWDRAKGDDPDKRQDIFVMYWYPDYPDAYSWLANLFHSAKPINFNLTYLTDSGVDSSIDRLPELTATNRTGAQSAYQDLQRKLLTDEAVAAPLYVQQYQRVYSGDVEGYVDNPAYPNVVFVHQLRPAA